jgi:1,2-diacylglycerol 3-alpha-glucosyltransferase
VINEAMACGLPVLSGGNVGAAEEMVDDGVNGWRFDATDVGALADLMSRISGFDFPLSNSSSASRRILEERAPTIAFGKGLEGVLQL